MMEFLIISSTPRKGKSMNIITVGIDLAKNVFAVHGVNDSGKACAGQAESCTRGFAAADRAIAAVPDRHGSVFRRGVNSAQPQATLVHHARLFRQYGHTVKLMAPKFVAPYRMTGKRGKNDAADAAAICEAVTRPNMLFVPVKEEHQQIILCLHRTRQGFVEERTASYNRLARPDRRIRHRAAAES
jgi:transposase